MRTFWIPIIATLIIFVAGGFFYWEIREGTHYQLDAAERVDAYLTLFTVMAALTGSIFLVFQHWIMRSQLAQANMPRLYLAVLHHRGNEDPSNPHRTGIKYINLTDNDFEDLEISLYGSLDNNEPNQFLRVCKKKSVVQGRDSRDISIITDELLSDIGITIEQAKKEGRTVRIQAEHRYTYLRKDIRRRSPIYIFNFSSNTWDIDE